MSNKHTLYDKWVMDFRKILFCMGILAAGTIFNADQENAFAVAVVVQGISNVDGFWDYLELKRVCAPLKVLISILILLSILAGLFAFYTLVKSKDFFGNNVYSQYYIWGMLVAVGFPIIPLLVDMIMNIIQERKSRALLNVKGGEEVEF